MKKRERILNWKWIKKNFWNVVLIWIIWQIAIAIIIAILSGIFGINIT